MPAPLPPAVPGAGSELLTVAEMARADGLAVAGGIPGIVLMEAAGAAVAAAIRDRWPPRPALVLCGPGNNGGDGFVVARLLARAGWPVRLALLGAVSALGGDAALAAARWEGAVESLGPGVVGEGAPLVVDAVFGAGLSRPVSGAAASVLSEVAARRLPVVAVDVPSGVDGDSGQVRGVAIAADLTVTFFRKKPGHLLLPGRRLCGEVAVVDIGIPAAVLDSIRPRTFENTPAAWLPLWPGPGVDGHKFARGHGLVLGGGRMTGAARLAARAALRAGAGLITVACPPEVHTIYALALAAAMIEPVTDAAGFESLLADGRRNAVLLGPGAGASEDLRARVRATLERGRAAVLDADALTAFAGQTDPLFSRLGAGCLLTPHEGEFARLFPDLAGIEAKPARTRAAAARAGAAVLLKGADTVIAAACGRTAINANAPPDLATAGSGDVLAGIATGLLAQGVPAFEAGCAAAWLHGAAGAALGPGLIADDLPEALPAVLRRLRGR